MSKNLSFFKPHQINGQVEVCKATQSHYENQLSSQADTKSNMTKPKAKPCHLDIRFFADERSPENYRQFIFTPN